MTRRMTRSTLLVAALVAGVSISVCITSDIRADEAATYQEGYITDSQEGYVTDNQGGFVTDISYQGGGACRPWEYGDPALFYNFYAPNYCGGVPAQLYIAPRPVPPLVGHTYYTYQPLMPHEFTYPHHRTYRHYYDGGRGMTRTKVHWYSNPVVSAVKGIRHAIRIPR